MKEIKVAVIGAGNMAREHIKAFSGLPGVAVVGIHSKTRARVEALAKEFSIPHVSESIDALYKATGADIVVVTVFELSMKAVSFECFERPWIVLLEKPAGYNLKDAEEICSAAKEKKRKVFVGLNRRFNFSTRSAVSRLSAVTGPRYVRISDSQDPVSALAAGQPKEVVENWMFANSIHVIDLFRVFGRGEITEVKNLVSWDPNKPGLVLSKISFSSGDTGLYEGIWGGPGPWAVAVSTPMERIELRPLEQMTFQLKGERTPKVLEIDPVDSQCKAGFRVQAEAVVAQARGLASPAPTVEDSLASMRLVGDIFRVL